MSRQKNVIAFDTDELTAAMIERDLLSFIRFCFEVVRPGIAFQDNWHLDAMACQLTKVASGDIRRLIITLPPRSLKSLCTSVALPAFFLGHNPSQRVVVVCYSDQLSRNHANDFRQVVNHPLYQRAFPHMRLSRDTDREIVTTLRGKRIATSIDGSLTGMGGDIFVIDDPIKPGDVFSEAARARVIEWYRSTLLSRADDKTRSRILVVMQRVHQNDLAGYLIDQGGYDILNLPAIAQRDEDYELSQGGVYHRQRGELLHPTREPVSALRELKHEMGPIAFSAQYQQSPTPLGGVIIKRKWLKTYPDHPFILSGDRIIVSWDIALSEAGTADYTAGVVLLKRGELHYVLDVIRGKFTFEVLKRKIMEVKKRFGKASLLIEDSPISRGLIQSLREMHVSVISVRPESDKLSRVIAQGDLFAGGSVLLPARAAWLEDFIAELISFPGRHDDQVDALTQALAWSREFGNRRMSVHIIKG